LVAIATERRDAQSEDFLDIEMQYDVLFILSILCDNDIHRKVRAK
jgi:hypothetical protein